MNSRLFAIVLGSSLAIGFGFGFGLGASDQAFVIEATGTPFGSFVLKCDVPAVLPPAAFPEEVEEHLLWDDHIA